VSLRIKLALVFIIIPLLSNFVYLNVATDIFKKDKIAYVQSSLYQEGEGVAKRLREIIGKDLILVKNIVEGISSGSRLSRGEHRTYSNLIQSTQSIKYFGYFQYSSAGWTPLFEINKLKDFTPELKDSAPSPMHFSDLTRIGKQDLARFEGRYGVENKLFAVTLLLDLDLGSLNSFGAYQYVLINKDSEVLYNKEFTQKNLLTNEIKNQLSEIIKANSDVISTFFIGKDEAFLATYAPVYDNLRILTVIDSSHIQKALLTLKEKSIWFFVFIFFSSLGISIILSNRLTVDVKKLVNYASIIVQNKFNLPPPKVEQKEFRRLASTFKEMIDEIRALFQQLEEYNLELEDKVEVRTRDLNHALIIQKAMTDNLEDGFLLLDKKGFLTDTISRNSFTIFPDLKKTNTLPTLLKINQKSESVTELFKHVSNGMIDFSQFISFLPTKTKQGGKDIDLKYAPLFIENKFEGMIIVATDQTEKIHALNQFEEEKVKVNFIIKSYQNRNFIQNYLKEIDEYIDRLSPSTDLDSNKRVLHTIKGASYMLGIKDLGDYVHKEEDVLARTTNIETVKTKCRSEFEKFKQKFSQILGPNFFNQEESLVLVKADYLNSLLTEYPQIKSNTFIKLTHKNPREIFNFFEKSVKILCDERGIKHPHFEFQSNKQEIPFSLLKPIEIQLTHYARNIVDYAYNPQENLEINCRIDQMPNSSQYIITIRDNGNGIDSEQVYEVAKRKKLLEDKEYSHHEKLQMIFLDTVSTSSSATTSKGRGVGMSSLRTIVCDKLKGHIEINSKKTKGTELIILF
jgi:HAMP domain-containing protein/HPt (histidine-containing phosphotransfer) domain-containing protein